MLQMNNEKTKKRSVKKNLPSIKCECGHEIPLVSDFKALGKAIEEHTTEHAKKSALTQKEIDNLVDNLIAQVLKKASEIETSPADIPTKLSPKKQKNNQNKNP